MAAGHARVGLWVQVPGRRAGGPVGWLVAFMLAAGATFIVVRLLTPGDGSQVPPRTWAWTGEGVLVGASPGSPLRDGDLVTAIDGAPLGADSGGGPPPPAR